MMAQIMKYLKALDRRVFATINGNPVLYYLALFVGGMIVFSPIYILFNLREVVEWIGSLFH